MNIANINNNALPKGYNINSYEIVDILGAGGFGITYKAKDNLDSFVVIKEYMPKQFASRSNNTTVTCFPKDKDTFLWGLNRFLDEAKTLRRFDHPAIVKVLGYFEENNTAYFVMPFYEGETLEDYLKKDPNRVYSQDEILSIIMPIIEGLKSVHQEGFLHRDIAPDNILLRKNRMPVLIDFGASRNAIGTKSQTLSAIVKHGYSPPEQYTSNSKQDATTDIYAICAVLYEMITGKKPPESSARQMALLNDEKDPIEDIVTKYKDRYNAYFLQTIQKGLSLKQKDRIQNIEELQEQLVKEDISEEESTNISLQDLDDLIIIAGSDKIITNDEESMILKKAKDLGLNEKEAKEYISQAIKSYGWTREEEEKTENTVKIDMKEEEKTKLINKEPTNNYPAKQTESKKNILLYTVLLLIFIIIGGFLYFSSIEYKKIIKNVAISKTEDQNRLHITLLKTLKGHKSYVDSVAISQDGKYIVSGSGDNTIKIWDRSSGKLLKTLKGHKSYVHSVAISQDGKYIVSGSGDNTIKIWDRSSGKLLKTLKGHKDSVWSVAISQDGKYIVSGSEDKTIKIWDRSSGKLLKTLKGHKDSVWSVAISQDGKYIVSGSEDKTIKIWDRSSGKLLKTLKGHKDSVLSVAISQDGKYIVSGSWDGTIKIWDRSNGKLLKTLKEHKYPVRSVAISQDGKYIVSDSGDKTIKIRDRSNGKLLKTLEGHKYPVESVAISQDGKYIVSGSFDSTIKIWQRSSGKLLKTLKGHKGYVLSVAISQDGKYIVSGSDDKTIKVWKVNSPL